jgi:DtxR family Mn-dependent transcriptional regulator
MTRDSNHQRQNGSPTVDADVGRRIGRYLLAIQTLSRQGDRRVRTGELGRRLDVSDASVTEMLGKLADRGLVAYEKYDGVVLTEVGRETASRLAWRFCVVTNFFDTVVDADLTEEQSYEIGHTLPADGVERLSGMVDHPCIDRCPETSQEYDGCLI